MITLFITYFQTRLHLKYSKTAKMMHSIFKQPSEKIVYVCSVPSVMSNSLETLWTAAHQAPLSMGFSRQEYWSGLSFPPPGDLPNLGIEPTSSESPVAFQVDTLPTEPPGKSL